MFKYWLWPYYFQLLAIYFLSWTLWFCIVRLHRCFWSTWLPFDCVPSGGTRQTLLTAQQSRSARLHKLLSSSAQVRGARQTYCAHVRSGDCERCTDVCIFCSTARSRKRRAWHQWWLIWGLPPFLKPGSSLRLCFCLRYWHGSMWCCCSFALGIVISSGERQRHVNVAQRLRRMFHPEESVLYWGWKDKTGVGGSHMDDLLTWLVI